VTANSVLAGPTASEGVTNFVAELANQGRGLYLLARSRCGQRSGHPGGWRSDPGGYVSERIVLQKLVT
jgi:hypothetical protein